MIRPNISLFNGPGTLKNTPLPPGYQITQLSYSQDQRAPCSALYGRVHRIQIFRHAAKFVLYVAHDILKDPSALDAGAKGRSMPQPLKNLVEALALGCSQ